MNVLFHCLEFPPQAGGVGGYINQMASALRLLGHSPVIVTSRLPGLPEQEEATCGRVYRAYDRSEARSARVRDLVLSIAREHRVSLIEGADHHGELASILRRSERPPVLVKIHGSNPVRILQESHVLHNWQRWTIGLARLRNAGQTRAEAFSMEHADMVMIPSRRMRDELLRQGLRLPAKQAIVPNPVVPVPHGTAKEAGNPTVLLVGRSDVGKGIQYLPDLVSRLAPRFPGFVLEIAGDDSFARGLGSMQTWLKARLADGGSQVRFLGRLGPEALSAAYERAWVVILPSRWDNFPTVLLEAMMRAKPAVTSPHGGMPEMLEGTLCHAVDPASPAFADDVARLLDDADLRRRAGDSMWAKAERAYSPQIVVQEYLKWLSTWGIV